ncbi:MAG: hypothetical protein SPI72_03300 [Porphyromonas sp.]|nr:hypothetical protein [Porphyromonas sp.]
MTHRTSHLNLPEEKVQIAIPISSLRDLPLAAGYGRRIGRASVNMVRTGRDTLSITAHCDSLQLIIDELMIQQERLEGLNAQLASRLDTEVSKTSEPAKSPSLGLSWTLVIVLLILLLLWRLRPRQND